jgi:hypothetical protein
MATRSYRGNSAAENGCVRHGQGRGNGEARGGVREVEGKEDD